MRKRLITHHSLLIMLLLLAGGAGAQEGALVTNTPLPGETPAATITPTPIPATRIPATLPPVSSVSVIYREANIRAEPSTDAAIISTTTRGTSFPVVGQREVSGELWYEIQLAEGQTGWLFGQAARRALLWRPVFSAFDDVEMVKVPPGCFVMGGEQGEDDEQPAHVQCFERAFWIDRYEVTNQQYGSHGYFEGGARPRELVNWAEATAFCQQRGARLPTEAEWEYAARGPESWVYPWGNEFVDANAVSSWQETARVTEPVGSRPSGASWVGALDMAGNVWEWTSTVYAPYPYDAGDGREDPENKTDLRVVRGGACCSYIVADVRSAYRFAVDPGTLDPNIGFRCVRDE